MGEMSDMCMGFEFDDYWDGAPEHNAYRDGPYYPRKEGRKMPKDNTVWECPECGPTLAAGILVKRVNSKTGREFWGCSNFPSCDFTENIEDEEEGFEFEFNLDSTVADNSWIDETKGEEDIPW